MDIDNLTWIPPDTSDNNMFEVDVLLTTSFKFFNNLETVCLAECCGIGAFSFYPDDIKRGSDDLDKNKLIKDLESAISELKVRTEKTIVSSHLNNLFEKTTFIHLLEYVVTTLKSQN